jgi:hypothetical protein
MLRRRSVKVPKVTDAASSIFKSASGAATFGVLADGGDWRRARVDDGIRTKRQSDSQSIGFRAALCKIKA